ncbi:MAG: response regulator [Bacteroidia bacterium]
METSDKIKIFLVDDDVMFTESLKHLLSEDRAEIKSFTTGEECIKYLDEEPEIIILDYSLNNEMNGVQVLNRIKHFCPDTKIIMLSGVDNENIINDTLKYGAYDFIAKGEKSVVTISKEVREICEDIESSKELDRQNNRLLAINLTIILLFIIIFILTRII